MSDELQWKSRNDGTHFRADSMVEAGTYWVYLEPWATPNHLVAVYTLDDDDENRHRHTLFRSLTRDFDHAKRVAQNHHDAACRAARWREFMRDNEPPAGLAEVSAVLRKATK
jgi:hypothetical protein